MLLSWRPRRVGIEAGPQDEAPGAVGEDHAFLGDRLDGEPSSRCPSTYFWPSMNAMRSAASGAKTSASSLSRPTTASGPDAGGGPTTRPAPPGTRVPWAESLARPAPGKHLRRRRPARTIARGARRRGGTRTAAGPDAGGAEAGRREESPASRGPPGGAGGIERQRAGDAGSPRGHGRWRHRTTTPPAARSRWPGGLAGGGGDGGAEGAGGRAAPEAPAAGARRAAGARPAPGGAAAGGTAWAAADSAPPVAWAPRRWGAAAVEARLSPGRLR